MLTPTDIHYLIGLLSKASHPENVEVQLGDWVLDEASESKRDVDVTITVRNIDGTISVFKGIEVKAHKRKLGSETVEQLVQKLKDMPTVTNRVIVSASGYTKPAVKKALHHGVELYELKNWQPDRDFAHFNCETVPAAQSQYRWLETPEVRINPRRRHSEDEQDTFRSDPDVLSSATSNDPPRKLSEWLKDISMLAAKEINDRARPSLKEGMQHFNGKATVRFTDAPFVRTADSMLLIEEVCFEGIVERLTTQMPTAYKALVKHGESKPFAGCCISDFGTWGLIGLIVTDDRTIQLASIPVAARNKSKIFREKVN